MNPILLSCFLRVAAFVSVLVVSVDARATPVEFTAALLEDDGSTFVASFFIDSSDLDAQPSLIEEVNDFIAVVDGTTYSWGPALPDPLPFSASAAYDAATRELIAIGTPFITGLGQPSTTNLRLLLDGTWTANTCIPLPRCNPDYLYGTYTVTRSVVPEPRSFLLVSGGLLLLAGRRPTSSFKRHRV